MTSSQPPTVAVVDDDEAVRDALSNLLASLDLGVATFASAEAFLASPACRDAACLIADVQMPGMSGLDLQRHLAESGNRLPVILITAFPAGACPPAGRGRRRLRILCQAVRRWAYDRMHRARVLGRELP